MSEVLSHLAVLVGSRKRAEALLAETTLRHLASAPLDELERFLPAQAARRFYAAVRVGRHTLTPTRPPVLLTAHDVFKLVHPVLAGREAERMVVVACDVRLRALATTVVAEGTPIDVTVRIADLFAPAVRHRAFAIVMAHNHPSDDPTPSEADRILTDRATAAGVVLGIDVLDHLVVAGDRFVSIKSDFPSRLDASVAGVP